MSRFFSTLDGIAQTLCGERITLVRDRPELLPYIQGLSRQEKAHMRRRGYNRAIFEDSDHYCRLTVFERQTGFYVPMWVIDDHRQKITGEISITPNREKPELIEIGGYIFPKDRRQGYVSESFKLVGPYLLEHGFATHVIAQRLPSNVASQRSLIKAGFTHCGKGILEDPRYLTPTTVCRFVLTREEPTWPNPPGLTEAIWPLPVVP